MNYAHAHVGRTQRHDSGNHSVREGNNLAYNTGVWPSLLGTAH